jgi:uncharacterized membrane protein YbjE (DUF340 family)
MNKEKIKLVSLIVVFCLFIATFGLWMVRSWQNNPDFTLSGLILPLVLIAIIAIIIPIIMRNARSIKSKEPVEDERSKRATTKAGYYTFLFSIYLLLGLGWFGDDYFTRPSQATGAAILVMAIVFLALILFFNKKGKL